MNKELSSIVEQLFGGLDEQTLDSNWYPRADIYRFREGWLIKLELAGVNQEYIEVSVSGAILKIQGKRRNLIAKDISEAYKMEISYNRFERVIELPEILEDAQIAMDFNQEMLLIRLYCESNENDLRDLPEHVRDKIQFVFVERVEDVLVQAIPTIQILNKVA